MYDVERDPLKPPEPARPVSRLPGTAAPTPASVAPPGGSQAHDQASLLHLQRTAGNAGVVQLLAEDDERDAASPVHDVIGSGGGSPLDDSMRSSLDSRFGPDCGHARLPTDEQASQSAASVGANAYTVGSDIVFRSGQYDAGTPTGQRTIAHELAHVVQQRSGPVDGTDAPGGIRLSDPGDRFERSASSTAEQVMSDSSPASSATAGQVELPEDEMPVQRDMGGEEEEELDEGDV